MGLRTDGGVEWPDEILCILTWN